MHQETTDEFRIAKGDLTFRVRRFKPPGGKSNVSSGNEKYPAVRDSDLMCVASKIFDNVAETVEGLFDKRAPILFIESLLPFLKRETVF